MSLSIIPSWHALEPSIGANAFLRAASALLRNIMLWPSRVRANRQLLTIVNGMSDYELSDIGLSRQDVTDSTALPLTSETGAFFAARASERRRNH